MSTDVEEEKSDVQGANGGTRLETIVSLLFCCVVLLVPMIYIEQGYDAFTEKFGEAKEGAAGTGLALAVVFRTVSRTVLRTIVRTSARAGVRASLKGAIKNTARTAMRAQTSAIFKKGLDDNEKSEKKHSNIKSLWFASALLYISWVVVIGIGQPYAALLNEENSVLKERQEQMEQEKLSREMSKPAIITWEKEQQLEEEEQKLADLRIKLKGERDDEKQEGLQAKISLQKQSVTHAAHEFSQAFIKSKERVLNPNQKEEETEVEVTSAEKTIQYLFTYAPYPKGEWGYLPKIKKDHENYLETAAFCEKSLKTESDPQEENCSWQVAEGRTSVSSMVLWVGGLVMVLPLWFIFFFQNWIAKREGTVLEHQTEGVGGAIQLYFAGAFSFMPLTSDVVVDTTIEKRGKIAAAGILPPTLVAIILWAVWKQTQITEVLFVADAFLLFPMVQIFPLEPLEGIHLWRWKKLYFLTLFFVVMGMFLLAGSEALKNVI